MDYQYYDDADYMDDEGGIDGIDDFYADHKFHNRYARHTEYPDDDDDDDNDAAADDIHDNLVPDYGSLSDRLYDSYANCMLPSLIQVFSYLLPLLFGCLLCRVLCQLYARRRLQRQQQQQQQQQQDANSRQMAPLHAINIICGLAMLYVTLGERMLLLLLLSFVSYALLQLVRLSRGGQRAAVAIAVLSIGSQFVYELALLEQRQDWAQLRGLQMVANMKVISLGFDLTAGLRSMPSLWTYLGYIFQPASCILGPWLSYGRYLDSLCHRPHWRRSLLHTLLNLLLCLLALSVSNCIAPAWGELQMHRQQQQQQQQHETGAQWLLMYAGALSVRSSHYFVSFLSQALLATSGQQLDTQSRSLGALVARPWHIEWPHSLSALVRCWNLPMHEWLKRYVYSASKQRSRHNTIVAVFCTYIVSSLLHGMDFRIYLVLLSLATFGQGEAMLRRHLATLCNACIAANPCPGAERCRYTRCPRRRGWRCASSWLVATINVAFTLLAIWHLAYLGVVLLNETLSMEAEHELPFMYHWAAVGYFNHYIGIGMFMLYLFIS
ncbi:hypothetical protein KR215_000610 [Drosophila sulfurigaster]|nr:hypothetical protein KR215_000610 [Drosophila sulfurigaster]